MNHVRVTLLLGFTCYLLSACNSTADDEQRRVGIDAFIDVSQGEESVCGVLRVDLINPDKPSFDYDKRASYRHTFRRSAEYPGMEDNDIRGYLDGSFKEGWNQVGQTHLRLGRRGRNPAYGEFELFRNLHRWADLPLPAAANILDADLTLSLQSGPPFAVDVAVYAVLKDWNPGAGGVNKDNNSPPEPGDAWWVDAQYGASPWSHAGAGHASDTDPNADTGAQPLSISRYVPGESKQLVFSSDSLTHYVGRQVKAGKPVLLLYKLLDKSEDSPGSVMELWSANFGVAGSTTRRPALQIRWQSTNSVTSNSYPLALEPGRTLEIQSVQVGGKRLVATDFQSSPNIVADAAPQGCSQYPYLEYRLTGSGNDWMPLSDFLSLDADEIDLRVSAVTNPVALGEDFTARIRHTWVTTGDAQDQDIYWEFTSPDGRQYNKTSEYAGDFTWRILLKTDAIGRWHYRWHHALAGHPVESDLHYFDVVAWERSDIVGGLIDLQQAIRASGAEPKSHEMIPYELSFMRLERAAMVVMTTDTGDKEIRAGIKAVRELLSGSPVPDVFVPEAIKSKRGDPNPQ